MTIESTRSLRIRDYKRLLLLLVLALPSAAWSLQGLSRREPAPSPPVLQATVTTTAPPAPRYELQRIETIRVGQRVYCAGNPTGERDERFGDDVEPSAWRKMVLSAPKRDGSRADVEMLRPLAWLKERDVRPGGQVDIEVPECGIEGLADVVAVEPCPPVPPGQGRVVTATFHHQAARTLDVRIANQDKPIGTTPNHLFWSATEQDFVRADQLRPGEQVQTLDGLAQVASITERGPPEPVFNLEVQGEHVYHVGSSGTLVHNACPGQFPVDPDDLLAGLPRDAKGRIYPSDRIRIRPEAHQLKPGEIYAPRHHGQHYHVETRLDPLKSWNNKKNVIKIKPDGYQPGDGTGFLPGEVFPGNVVPGT